MVLANLSRDLTGASRILQEGTEIAGLHLVRLINWFVGPRVPFPEEEKGLDDTDAMQFIAHILTNVSQLPSGRRLLCDPQRRMYFCFIIRSSFVVFSCHSIFDFFCVEFPVSPLLT